MVCLGNICRSPLAEGIMKHKVKQYNLNWQVDSAGIGDWHVGELPDRRSIAKASQNGIDITDQRARQIQSADMDNFDLILAMDCDNYRDILKYAKSPEHHSKVNLILNYVRPGINNEVPDPYYDGRFEHVFQLLDEACEAVIKHFRIK
jgi:protein-tyrosine phosphatase